jgi:hypothetical protein
MPSESTERLTCTQCGREYMYDSRRGHTRTMCNSCKSNYRLKERQQERVTYLGGKCSVCGYDKCAAALDFHHVDASDKGEFQLSQSHCRSWDAVKAELDKCVLLCRNCHAEYHYNNPGHTKGKVGRPRKPESG